MNRIHRSSAGKVAVGSALLLLLAILSFTGFASAGPETPFQTNCDVVGVNCGEQYCVASGWREGNLRGEPHEYCWIENCTLYATECIIG